MRRLHIDQEVSVCLDGEREAIGARVLDVRGAVGRFACDVELAPRSVARLVTGVPGYLVFDQLRTTIGLRVAVRTKTPDLGARLTNVRQLEVAVMDGIALPERRRVERVPLATPARIVRDGDGAADGAEDWTETINLSERGAFLRGHPALIDERHLTIELTFGDDPDPIRAQARVARRSPQGVAVVFESIEADGATRLEEFLAGRRQQRRQLATP